MDVIKVSEQHPGRMSGKPLLIFGMENHYIYGAM